VELAATAEEMSGQAEQLQQLMSFFKIDSGMQAANNMAVAKAAPRKAAKAVSRSAGAPSELEFVRF
jgi:methyl-accepting chemotaxis protein